MGPLELGTFYFCADFTEWVMENNNNLPNPEANEEGEEQEKKKKGGLAWLFGKKAGGRWGTGVSGQAKGAAGLGRVGKPGSFIGRGASGSRIGAGGAAGSRFGAGAAGSRLVGGAGARIGSGSSSIFARLAERLGLGKLLGPGGLLGRGGAIARFLATKAGMAIAGVLVAALAVTAAMYYKGLDNRSEEIASASGDGFSPYGQSSVYPMPGDKGFGGDNFMGGSVPNAGSMPAAQSSGILGSDTASGTSTGGTGTAGEAGGGGSPAYDFGGGGGGGGDEESDPFTPPAGTGTSVGTGTDTSTGGGSVGKEALSTSGLRRFGKSASSGTRGTVRGAGAGKSTRAYTALKNRTLAQSTKAAQMGNVESAFFTGGNAFDEQSDVGEASDVEVDTGDDVAPPMTDTGTNPDIDIPYTYTGIDPIDIPGITLDPGIEAMAETLVEDYQEALALLNSTLGIWQNILAANGGAVSEYGQGVAVAQEAMAKGLKMLDDVNALVDAGGHALNGTMDGGALISTEIPARLALISQNLITFWLYNATLLAAPIEACNHINNKAKLEVSPTCTGGDEIKMPYSACVCQCYRGWWNGLKTAQIGGGYSHNNCTTNNRCYYPKAACDPSNQNYITYKTCSGSANCSGAGCSLKKYIAELDPEKIRQEMSAEYGCAAQLAGAKASFDACATTAEANELQNCKDAAAAVMQSAQSGICQKTWSAYANGLMAMRSDYVLSGNDLYAEEGNMWQPSCTYISNSEEENSVRPSAILTPIYYRLNGYMGSARPVIKKLIEGQMNVEGAGTVNMQ